VTPFERLHPAVQYQVVNDFGWSGLRGLQEAAIEPVLDGADALLLAPTASGKTEAAVLMSGRGLGTGTDPAMPTGAAGRGTS
jgi:ATP-dependent Lhr-like helicase